MAVLLEVENLLNHQVEHTVILNDITQDNNKVLGDKSSKNVKFHRMEGRTEELVSTFQSVVELEQQNGGPQKKQPPEENENLARRLNQEQEMDKSINRFKGVESQSIYVGFGAGAEVWGKPPTEKGVICTGKKVYRPPLPSTYKERELLEDINDDMEWVFRYYVISLKKSKDPLPPRDDVMEFDVRTNTTESENNIKLQGWPSDLQYKVKEVVTEYWYVFCEDGLRRPIQVFKFHIDTGNHQPIFCKPARYGPHESAVMQKLAERPDENGMVEEDYGTWGALVIIAEKPHQENVPWHDY